MNQNIMKTIFQIGTTMTVIQMTIFSLIAQPAAVLNIDQWGDVNQDTYLDGNDLAALVDMHENGTPIPAPIYLADTNNNGFVAEANGEPDILSLAQELASPTELSHQILAGGPGNAVLSANAYLSGAPNAPFDVAVVYSINTVGIVIENIDITPQKQKNVTFDFCGGISNGAELVDGYLVEFDDVASGISGYVALTAVGGVLGEVTAVNFLGVDAQETFPNILKLSVSQSGVTETLPTPSKLTSWTVKFMGGISDGVE